jgi:two-component system cell cycle response regulator
LNPEAPNPNRVLVIDDSEPIHKLIEARLRPEGLQVTSEFDGRCGIERAVQDTPDLILLDVGLPDVDGFEVCRQLKEHPATRDIPIIFLTGTTSTDSKVRGLDLGAVDYVTKPFDQVELRARVRAALRTKRLQDILEQQSFLDGLTGLWNRPYLDQRIDAELNVAQRYGRPVSLILCDIDHFKRVNDNYGHLFGDLVLQGVADSLRGHARRSDIVARYGGEEFSILLCDTGLRSGSFVAERLRSSIESRAFEAHSERLSITASFGMGSSEELDGQLTVERLIEAADAAMYASKDAGRNCIHMMTRSGVVRTDATTMPASSGGRSERRKP